MTATAGGWPQPAAHGPSLATAQLRTQPEHFSVDEIPNWTPTGDGEHDVVYVEKRGANTRWVAGALARHSGCHARDVGHAGLKDRHAVTRQWFSVQRGGRRIDWNALEVDGVRVLEVHAHRRKLRPGALVGNRFRIVAILDDRGAIDSEALESRIAAVKAQGVPNYFGPQRFGRDGGNLVLAGRLAAGERLGRGDRSFAVSAARAALFNAVLARRVADASWCVPQSGDALMLSGSNSFFLAGPDESLEALRARADRGDLQPTGPLWGEGASAVAGEVAALESRVAQAHPEWVAATHRARAEGARRALRVFASEFEMAPVDAGYALSFTLPAGSFATTVVNEFFSVD
ncbi:MAG: tRNA pseudouridine(13) synthase TruD [Pseudomonadota bacterium]